VVPLVVQQAPRLAASEAAAIARELFGLVGALTPLPSERDQNFLVTASDGTRFVLKIFNATEEAAFVEAQHQVLEHLQARGATLVLPRTVPTRSGAPFGVVHGPAEGRHLVRLLTWVPGTPLADVRPHGVGLLESLGRRLGELDRLLAEFAHPAVDRVLPWDLARAAWIRHELRRLADPGERGLVEQIIARYDAVVVPALASLPTSVIHNDCNDWNVLVGLPSREGGGAGPAVRDPAYPDRREVVGLVDFGDMVRSATVCDLAIACAYAMLDKPDPLGAAAAVVRGYHAERPLEEGELAVLFDLIRTRLAVSLVMAACQRALAPENAYLGISERGVRALLRRLAALPPELAHYSFRDACQLEPCPCAPRVAQWLRRHRDQIGAVVDVDVARDPVLVFDLSVGSADLPLPLAPRSGADQPVDLAALARLVADRIARSGARAAIGRYGEPRWFPVPLPPPARGPAGGDEMPPGGDGEEPRTIHLGLDLFLPPGSPVYAPLDGLVHSLGDNAAPLDYGPTVVLEHRVRADTPEEPAGSADTPPLVFYTLYGHLARASLESLREGQAVRRGDRIGWVGDRDVNGGWPPHLHVQLIVDLLGWRGDFPGFAPPGRQRVWKSLCPDANLIVRAPAERLAGQTVSPAALLERRRAAIGPSLSVSYRRPLVVARGYMQYLYDHEGRRYLDAVNNVAHVGHSHPRVVEAVSAQLAVLNTNTRYLYEHLVQYAERLTALLPPPLRVCFFVSSGSEANELALRLARAHTGHHDVIVLEGAYHGNTSTLVAISPYKCEGPGGTGLPRWVRKVRLPDVYRGPYGAGDPEAGRRYAQEVAEAVEAIRREGRGVAAFFCESLPSCAGQIVLPPGYLAEAARHVRAAGGVVVVDEVQVGFGRVGTHWWGFETQGVVPDIVTMGKPIGNGFPLGAVVTTAEIAASFANGMEYFSSFGGNPVACAAGIAVLDVIVDEGLREQARDVGAYLKARLEALKARCPLVGDVRGLGLFLGIELVRDGETLEPAAEEASYVVNRLRDRGVLVSTDGLFRNVLKIKPPLVFTRADADRLADELASVLAEDPVRL
jgi:4-aminobutyrate aminotransferase-like enzyme/Ser/Thr protein kinase RdoA (MazF antagonist)